MRSAHNQLSCWRRFVGAAATAIIVLGAMGCAGTPAPPSQMPPAAASARQRDVPTAPGGAPVGRNDSRPDAADTAIPGPATPEEPPGGSAAEEAPGPPTGAATAPRLAWVNPARCLTSCTYNPGSALLRLNDQGQPDGRGKHRVATSAARPLAELMTAARAAGHLLRINSAFRSYQEQGRVFRTTKERGRAARPGHSEHQLGTAIDLRLPTSAAIAWLADHAADHGFALSYPARKQRLTGYRPEPWHIRFVGRAVAEELRQRGTTLEELLRAQPERGESGTCDDCPAASSRLPCGRVTTAGACDGTVLTWCYEGALASVDCAVSAQTCGHATGGVSDCL